MTKRYTKWRQEHVNTDGQPFRSANTATNSKPEFSQKMINAIANLATTTASDQATVAKLTVTISELTTELKKTQTKLAEALKSNARLAATRTNTNKENVRPGCGAGNPANPHYCWTHSFLCTDHSGKCPNPKARHVENAKSRYTQGGSQLNKEEWIKIVTGQK